MTEKSQNDYALTAHLTRDLLAKLVDHVDNLPAPEFASYGDFADLEYMFSQLKQLTDRYNIAEVAA